MRRKNKSNQRRKILRFPIFLPATAKLSCLVALFMEIVALIPRKLWAKERYHTKSPLPLTFYNRHTMKQTINSISLRSDCCIMTRRSSSDPRMSMNGFTISGQDIVFRPTPKTTEQDQRSNLSRRRSTSKGQFSKDKGGRAKDNLYTFKIIPVHEVT